MAPGDIATADRDDHEMPYNTAGGFPRITGEGMKGALGNPYFAHADLIAAVNVALACEMPLLLTGEAGCGKTDFAFAVAGRLAALHGAAPDDARHRLLECYVRSDTRARDLLYHYDAVRRFSDAQFRAARVKAGHSAPSDPSAQDHPGRYVGLNALGRALVSASLRVVLIDEIDKAPRDLPNDLLQPLDKGRFEIPEFAPGETWTDKHGVVLGPVMEQPQGAPKPLVIITSNEERQLPEPFLRRCVFFHIDFPAEAELDRILSSQPGAMPAPMRRRILRVFLTLRRSELDLTKPPATAELLRWTQALINVFDRSAVEQRLQAFAQAVEQRRADDPLRNLPWRAIPGIGCLVKLRDDFEKIGLAAGVQAGAR